MSSNSIATIADRNRIESEMPWEERDLPKTLYSALKNTAEAHTHSDALSFQLLGGPQDKKETLNWADLRAKTIQAANLFRSLGVGERDVVAFVLPNCSETVMTLWGGAIAGIVSPINPLLEPEQIAAILRETGAKASTTITPRPRPQQPGAKRLYPPTTACGESVFETSLSLVPSPDPPGEGFYEPCALRWPRSPRRGA